eukprot:CAMPEP_0113636482 /NCGR_PEP_ID=MMETSP0017_2-20120614/19047_1 /TAXON_ID=2856 /ORGANISM="Cylindrotheca closterium" /LENGTH=220 /DNA_ID=CAMNT_0000547367 /DNA_START=24 /DNA_END=682 /DNA_ORIENTATION=- /assembly_acc=CAM_ASM_000147
MYPCTQETLQQPQSIVHHLSRMGSKMVVPFRKQQGRSAPRRRKRCSKHDDEESLQQSQRTSASAPPTEPADSHDEWSATSDHDCYNDESVRQHSALHEEDEEDNDFFIPLDQNEFLIECFMANECSDVTFIVLFSAGRCNLSEQLEDVILIRTMESGSNCQCRRVDSYKAPMFTKKLQIDLEQPTLVAIKNGSVVSRISNISPSGCWELEKWLTDTKILT